MKRLLCIVLVLLFASVCGAQQIMVTKKKSPPECGSLGAYENGASSYNFGKTTGAKYVAWEFVPSAGTIKEVQISLKDAGSPAEVIQLAICTSNGGTPPAPTTTCTNSDNTLAGTGNLPGGSFVWAVSEFSAGYAVTAQSYFIRVYTAQADDSNYYAIAYSTTGVNQISGSTDGTTWTSTDQTAQGNYRVTSCTDWE